MYQNGEIVQKIWEIVYIRNTSKYIWRKGKLHITTYIIIHPITTVYLKKQSW